MKKFYFLITCLMLIVAMQVKAEVTSLEDLYGNYKFTAKVEFTNAATSSHKSQLSGECDATISKHPTQEKSAQIIGFAGSQVGLRIWNIDTEKKQVEMTNPRNPDLWNDLFLANKNGDNPYGVFSNDTWEITPYNTEYYTYDPETKNISIPDFTVVRGSGNNFTIIAKYTDVKMIFISSEEKEENEETTPEDKFNWAGEYTLKTSVTPFDNGSYPEEFSMEVIYNTDYDMYLVTKFLGYDNDIVTYNYGGLLLTPAEDGASATLNTGLITMMGGQFVKLRDLNGSTSPISLTLNNDGSVNIADFCLVKGPWDSEDSNTNMAYYHNITATKVTTEAEDGVENIFIENSCTIYDLTGRRIEEISKAGIYIINGKKQIIK